MKIIFQSIILIAFAAGLTSCSNTTSDTHSGSEENVTPVHETSAKPDHSVMTLKKQSFASVIRTSGRIMVDSKDVTIVTAKSSGIIKFIDHYLFPGVKIAAGQVLFTVSGEQLAEGNTDLRLTQLRSDLEKASANYERARSLIDDRIITQENFLEIKSAYEKLVAEYQNLSSNFGTSGSNVLASANGYIREVMVTEGQMVNAGQPLASIVIEHSMILKADVPPAYMGMVPSIEKANFTVGYSSRLFKTEEMGGKRISYGKSIEDNSYYVPVYFRIDYDPELIDGTFADVYLTGRAKEDIIVVPNSSLMEEFGKFYVFVEDADGDFLKRYVTTGDTNGESTEVTGGLSGNEVIVATGAYNIKLSLMTNSAPAHTHNH
jgi:RND family efflux transporter MFP subunit